MGSTNPSFMNGVPELLVLRLLQSREMYGYQIVQAIRDETSEVVSLGEGVVYPVLHALESSGAISSQRRAVNGRSRIYYALSPQGVTRLTELTALWSRLTNAVQQVLESEGHAAIV
ncbi:MAG TPA: PadR family transcriptional regulator [Caulobacteraceae bacterium]|jgi:PadR family transcriptional regulator PadR